MRTAAGGWLAALRFASATEAHGEFAARAADRAARPGVATTTRVDFGAVQWLRWSGTSGTGLVWQSDRWVFMAEAPDDAVLAKTIADSQAGGTGPLPAVAMGGIAGVAVLALLVIGATVLGLMLLRRALLVRPPAGVLAVDVGQLKAQLLALNGADRPWQVRTGAEAGVPAADLVVEWKWADATWWGVLAKSGVKRTYRLRLYLDAARTSCGALDETSEVEWTAGALGTPGLSYSRSFFRGVQLVRRSREVAWGSATPLGAPGIALDARFDLDALKQPVIAAVTAAGWTFRPLLWPPRRRTPP